MSYSVNITRIKAVSNALDKLATPVVFVGGATASLYADVEFRENARPTDDVDVVVELLAYKNYAAVEQQLRAIGGSLTGFVGKKIMNVLAVHEDWLWAVIYILLITILWPLAVLVVSIPFGQFRFFLRYIKKIGVKMGISPKKEPEEKR